MQVALYEVFQRYYEQDPTKHAAPIPTVSFFLPISKTASQDICYAQRYLGEAKVSDRDIRATTASIIAAALELDSNAEASAIQRHNPKVGDSTVRKYILKRNHSGFARKVIQLTLDLSNWQPESGSKGLLETAPAHASFKPSQGAKTSEGSKAASEVHDRLHDAQQLMEAAERMLREGCGEQWLLQPLIPDMGCNEYRQAASALGLSTCV